MKGVQVRIHQVYISLGHLQVRVPRRLLQAEGMAVSSDGSSTNNLYSFSKALSAGRKRGRVVHTFDTLFCPKTHNVTGQLL